MNPNVFSLGVLVLEIVSGQRNNSLFFSLLEAELLGKVSEQNTFTNSFHIILSSYVCFSFLSQFLLVISGMDVMEINRSMELVDPSFGSDFSFDEVLSE